MKVISFTPTRLSIFGGGTDLEPFASKYGSLIVNLAINIRQKCVLYSQDDRTDYRFEFGKNIFPNNADPKFYYHILDYFTPEDIAIKTEFVGNIRSGLGSSGSAAVCLIGAINKLKGLNFSLEEITQAAYKLETSFGVKTGYQDHLAATYGGLNVFHIGTNSNRTTFKREIVDNLCKTLVLFYTGHSRNSSLLQHGFDKLTKDKIETLNKIKDIAGMGAACISVGSFEEVGVLLDKAWELKKLSNKVSTPEIDNIYRRARDFGALGGKVLGAGGGGYMLFAINPDKRKEFIKNMDIEEVDWLPDYNGLDTRIL